MFNTCQPIDLRFTCTEGACVVPLEDAKLTYAEALKDWEDALRDADLSPVSMAASMALLDRAYARLQRLVACPCAGAL